jgi:hypothetical protein
MPKARTLLWIASGILLATAGFHFMGWFLARGQFAGTGQSLAQLMWFSLDVDWLVVASLWFAAGYGGAALLRPLVILSAIIPLAAATAMFIVIGPAFFGLWLLGLAGSLAVVGAIRLGDEAMPPRA